MTDVATSSNTTSHHSPALSTKSRLAGKDMTLIIDASGSMSTRDCPGNKSRWEYVQEQAKAIAQKMDEFDPDGITVYIFNGRFKRFDNVTPEKVDQIFAENEPGGSTALHLVLEDAFKHWRERKASNELKGGEIIAVVTDGQPDDQSAVAYAITNVTKDMDSIEQLAVKFFQAGNDNGARQFLKTLDDSLPADGAKHDIVDTKTFDELQDTTISHALAYDD